MSSKRIRGRLALFHLASCLLVSGNLLVHGAEANLVDRAMKAYWAKEYRASIDLATEAIRQNPKNGSAYITRSLANCILQRCDKAVADFEQGISLSPCNEPVIFNDISQCYVEQGRYEKALSLLNTSLGIKATGYAFRAKGQILWKLQRREEALDSYSRALKLDPRDYWSLDDRSNCYFQLGRFQDALNDVNKLIKLRPNYARGFALRAKLYDKSGKKALADKDRQKAKELSAQEWF